MATMLGNYRNVKEDEEDITFADLGNPFTLFKLMFRERGFVTWLQRKKLICGQMECEKCGEMCKVYARTRNVNKFNWRCSKSHEIAITKYSFFENSKYTIQDMFLFITEFAKNSSLKTLSR